MTDPRVDAYIERSAPFAKPILQHLRKLVHKGCPEVTETIKWGFPFFDYKGPLCNMSAFKAHCGFGFWKTTLLPDPKKVLSEHDGGAGSIGKITDIKQLPADKIVLDLIKAAKKLNDEGVKVPQPKKTAPKKEVAAPDAMTTALQKNKKAKAAFDAFPPSHRKEYTEWIADAKTEATRNKRIATMLEWLEEGKSRHWKYQTK